MKWIKCLDRLPKSKGLYGVSNKNRNFPLDFYLAYFDGIGFKLVQDCDNNLTPYRNPIHWSKLKFGKD